jgi:hypothetical protein
LIVDAGKCGVALMREGSSEAPGDLRRFLVQLFVVHPAMSPEAISSALGLEAHNAQAAGEPRKTPKGTPLPGIYPDTRWRHSVECAVTDQWFAAEVTRFVDRLEPHRAFLAGLRSTGGKVSVIIQLLGDGYLSDEIPATTLAKLVELQLGLAFESFVVSQF